MRWEDFNRATLMFLKEVDEKYDMSTWSKIVFDKWSRVYRTFCGHFFETFGTFEMSSGDLLDWWEERSEMLVNMADQCLRQVRYCF